MAFLKCCNGLLLDRPAPLATLVGFKAAPGFDNVPKVKKALSKCLSNRLACDSSLNCSRFRDDGGYNSAQLGTTIAYLGCPAAVIADPRPDAPSISEKSANCAWSMCNSRPSTCLIESQSCVETESHSKPPLPGTMPARGVRNPRKSRCRPSLMPHLSFSRGSPKKCVPPTPPPPTVGSVHSKGVKPFTIDICVKFMGFFFS